MKKRIIIQRTIYVLMALIAVAGTISYLLLARNKPWTAFYVACCTGVLIVNLILILLFLRRTN